MVSLLVLCISTLLVQDCVSDDVSVLNVMQTSKLNAPRSQLSVTDYIIGPSSNKLQTAVDFIRKYGYPVESHTVTTEDGYLLTVHRIPSSPKATSSGVKTPVLLMHGLTTSSDSFLVMGPERSIGFLLADQGYDVWMGNFRGNSYARKHLTLSPKDPKFWNFTWHEMGVYDLPATIDYILETTNRSQLFFVGHSMGNTAMFVLASTRPQYNKKIRLFVTLAPTVYIHPLRSWLLKTVLPLTQPLSSLAKGIGVYDIPHTKSIQTFLRQVCREGNPLIEICLFFYFAVLGYNRDSFDTNIASRVFSQAFGGVPINPLVHYAETVYTDRFQVFDPTVTLGKFTPEYNLTQISAPIHILYADNDVFVHPDNVMRLRAKLSNVVGVYRVPEELATHADFILSKNVKHLVNDEVIAAIDKYK